MPMFRVEEFTGFGQLRPAHYPEINQYSMTSVRPLPFQREQQMIDEDRLITLVPPTIVPPNTGAQQPPNIPFTGDEDLQITQEMDRVFWADGPQGGSWNLNEPRGYKPNYKGPGFAGFGQEAAKPFPTAALLTFAGGATALYLGIKHETPLPTLIGLVAALGGGLALKDRWFA